MFSTLTLDMKYKPWGLIGAMPAESEKIGVPRLSPMQIACVALYKCCDFLRSQWK